MIVILGPTSSGKSDYAIALAKKINGEVISADSRQVYRGMDIGTGKVAREFSERYKLQDTRYKKPFFSEGVRHWLLDVASPKRDYNVTHFLRDAKKAIADIKKRGKVPIIAGGTAFWVESLLSGTSFPEVKPDKVLRERLGKCSTEKLFSMLKEKDPERAETIDSKNKVRLIRALEIIKSLGKVPANQGPSLESEMMALGGAKIIILNPQKEVLNARIESRLKKRLDQGMIDEVRRLHDGGVSWKRLERFGLEYRWCARFLKGTVSRQDLETKLSSDIKRYAKRQLTFLRRLEREGLEIEWTES